MKPKHTRGPWTINKFIAEKPRRNTGEVRQRLEVYSVDGSFIASLMGGNEFNAHLIAAAPEMFEALESLIDRLDLDGLLGQMSDELKIEIAKAATALAKARGES